SPLFPSTDPKPCSGLCRANCPGWEGRVVRYAARHRRLRELQGFQEKPSDTSGRGSLRRLWQGTRAGPPARSLMVRSASQQVRSVMGPKMMRSLFLTVILLVSTGTAMAGEVDRLYVIDCGWAHALDQSLWSPGVNVGAPIDFSDDCYLIHHTSEGYL